MPASKVRERPEKKAIAVMNNSNVSVLLLVMCPQISGFKGQRHTEKGQALGTV